MLRRAVAVAVFAAITVVLSPSPRAGDASEATYTEYHRAIRTHELCRDREFDQAEHEKMSIYIDRKISDSISVGRRLSLIQQAKREARDLVDKQGCDSEEAQELLSLFSRELQPALLQ